MSGVVPLWFNVRGCSAFGTQNWLEYLFVPTDYGGGFRFLLVLHLKCDVRRAEHHFMRIPAGATCSLASADDQLGFKFPGASTKSGIFIVFTRRYISYSFEWLSCIFDPRRGTGTAVYLLGMLRKRLRLEGAGLLGGGACASDLGGKLEVRVENLHDF